MNVTFCGHRDIYNLNEVEIWLNKILKELIISGEINFYLGGYGDFDRLCKKVLLKYKKEYPYIRIFLIVPYLNHNMQTKDFDEVIYPALENTPRKFAISKRNEYMINKSDIVVCYIKNSFGGAYKSFLFASRKKKIIINYPDTSEKNT